MRCKSPVISIKRICRVKNLPRPLILSTNLAFKYWDEYLVIKRCTVKQSNVAGKIRNCLICLFVFGLVVSFSVAEQRIVANLAAFPNPAGVIRTYNVNGDIDLTGSFFQSLGTNGLSCSTSHHTNNDTPALHAQL